LDFGESRQLVLGEWLIAAAVVVVALVSVAAAVWAA
jgi:hypothetical protein